MKNRLLSIFISFVLVISVVPSTTVSAKTVSQLQNELNQLSKKTQQAKTNLENAKKQSATLEEEIVALDKTLAAAQEELTYVEEEYNAANEKYLAADAELKQAVADREKHFNTFSKRIKYINEKGKIGYLEVILNAKGFNDFLIRTQYVLDIMRYDSETLTRLKEIEATIERTTKELEEQKNAKELLYNEQKSKTDALNAAKEQKKALSAQFLKDAESYDKMIKDFEAASAEVERLINQASSSYEPQQAYSGGKFAWPIPGFTRISSGYGNRARPIGSGYEFHTGIDIPGSYGTKIVAAEAGTVTTAGYVRGYGYTVIINHGGGISTLYGHNSSLVVSVGQQVSKGQTIAKCGSTGNSTGNHCHFEVRKNGTPTSPWNYL